MSGERPKRPSLLQRLSSYLLPQVQQNGSTLKKAQPSVLPTYEDESTILLNTPNGTYHTLSATASDQDTTRLLSDPTALARKNSRPNLNRSITTAAARPEEHTIRPVISRPEIHRALTSTAAIAGRPEYYTETTMESRPSLFSRAKTVVSNQLELGEGTSYAHRNAPPAPTKWDDAAHRRYLVRIWDAVEDKVATQSKYPVSTTARVVSTEKSMIKAFPDLSEGRIPLTREWIEYVLGVALRHPFCTADKMGRWEILASSSGTRGTWGPW